MRKCPICGQSIPETICAECGYDASTNYESHATLCMVSGKTISARKNEYERSHKNYHRCKGCGSSQFHLNLEQMQAVCTLCDMPYALPKPETPKPAPKPEAPAPAKQAPAPAKETATPRMGSPDHIRSVLKRNRNKVITLTRWGAVAVKNDGHLLVQPRKQWDMADGTFYLSRQDLRDLASWDNIVSVIANDNYLMALNSYGHVKVMGTSKYGLLAYHTFYSYSWKVIAIAGSKDHAVGLQSDGKVVATGYNAYGQCNVSEWSNTTIISIAAGSNHTVGLKADGTVVAMGRNDDGQCNVSHWENIVSIAATENLTIGLKADGTVTAAGRLGAWQEIYAWRNISEIYANADQILGLKSDGSCVCTGIYPSDNQDIVSVAADKNYTVAVKKDGTVRTAGKDKLHKEIAKWKDIKIPT